MKRIRLQTCIDENTEQRIIECSKKFGMEKNDFIRFVLNSFLIANDDTVNLNISKMK